MNLSYENLKDSYLCDDKFHQDTSTDHKSFFIFFIELDPLELSLLDVHTSAFLDQLNQLLKVSANNFACLLALFEELESRHGGDFIGKGNLVSNVDINSSELSLWNSVCQLVENWRDCLAWTTPGGIEVNDGRGLGICEFGKLIQVSDLGNWGTVAVVSNAGSHCRSHETSSAGALRKESNGGESKHVCC